MDFAEVARQVGGDEADGRDRGTCRWVAITAARLASVIGLILVVVLGDERRAELLGRSWSYVYADAKALYLSLEADAA